MPEQEKQKQILDALAAMAGGTVPSESESPSSGIPSETTVFSSTQAQTEQSPQTPAPPSQASRRPSQPRAAAPSAVPPPPPRRSTTRDETISPARPKLPQRPAAPIRPIADSSGESSDESSGEFFGKSSDQSPDDGLLDTLPDLFDDDETIAAAPDASAFAPRTSQKAAHGPIYANLFFRRTIIPILLTCGLMLPIIGIWSLLDPNSPIAAIGKGPETALIAVGIVLLGLGIVNALHVRQILAMKADQN
jgi:hypothetical protein